MELTVGSRLKKAWNAFLNRDPTYNYRNVGEGYSYRPDRVVLSGRNERSIVTSVYNRMAMDVAALTFKHCKIDENGKFISDIDSTLNECLNLGANIDQTGRAFIQDTALSLFDEGCIAMVPVDTSDNPESWR